MRTTCRVEDICLGPFVCYESNVVHTDYSVRWVDQTNRPTLINKGFFKKAVQLNAITWVYFPIQLRAMAIGLADVGWHFWQVYVEQDLCLWVPKC